MDLAPGRRSHLDASIAMPQHLTSKGNQRRKQIMDYAAQEFARNGYHQTSVSDIVNGLGVGKGLFYWYFESKEMLLREVLAQAQRDLRHAQRQAIADEPDPLHRIAVAIRASFTWLASNLHLFLLMEQAKVDEQFANLVRQGEETAIADTLPHVKAGMDAGLIRRDDPIVIAYAIIGVTSSLARLMIVERGEDPHLAATTAITFCLGGITAKKPANTGSNPEAVALRAVAPKSRNPV
ncbi:MAG: TetR/AcrR family transcriptional regulator [Actinobacteria bacterium]|nr:TetR/AcrR family transcriptional regulator [Actinomycetota bacterium]MCL5446201.1 TetR/AcrR family transcriptional regulator [Actinomycetota bacterium]